MCKPIKSIKTNCHKKAIGKRSNKHISVCQKCTDRNEIEVRGQGYQKEKERKEKDLRISKRPETQPKKKNRDTDEEERMNAQNRIGNRDRVSSGIIREN